ncbi:MAG TPA: hypothetical protein PLO56_09615 [Rhodothermales bacterium]|nr:hypothetical protein [Rhodothermales bacterium]
MKYRPRLDLPYPNVLFCKSNTLLAHLDMTLSSSQALTAIAIGLVVATLDMPALALKLAGFTLPFNLFFVLFFLLNIIGYGLIWIGAQILLEDSPYFRSVSISSLVMNATWVVLMILTLALRYFDLDTNGQLNILPIILVSTIDWFLVFVLYRGIKVEASRARNEALEWLEWFSVHMMLKSEKHEEEQERFGGLVREAEQIWFIYLSMMFLFIPALLYLWSYLRRWEFLWTALLIGVLHLAPVVLLAFFIFRVGQHLNAIEPPTVETALPEA